MSKSNHPPVELEHHRLAFEGYYSLGAKRTYQLAGDRLGVSASTVKLWSRTFGWRQRIQERDAEAARQVADRATQTTLEERERDLKIVRSTKMRLMKDILEGKVKGKLSDLEMLIHLEAELLGGTGDHMAWIERESDPEKLRTRLRALAATELQLENPPAKESENG